MPSVNLLNDASAKPAFFNIPIITSPCGNASIVAVRYQYAVLSPETILPYNGNIVCE